MGVTAGAVTRAQIGDLGQSSGCVRVSPKPRAIYGGLRGIPRSPFFIARLNLRRM